jgi:hypothetical protein
MNAAVAEGYWLVVSGVGSLILLLHSRRV